MKKNSDATSRKKNFTKFLEEEEEEELLAIPYHKISQKEISRTIPQAWKEIIRNSGALAQFQKLEIKRSIFESCILPVLTYES